MYTTFVKYLWEIREKVSLFFFGSFRNQNQEKFLYKKQLTEYTGNVFSYDLQF